MENEQLITLTADIVAAHVANNNVAVGDVANLVQQVHGALAKLGQPEAAPQPQAKTPVVSIRASVKPDGVMDVRLGSGFRSPNARIGSSAGSARAKAIAP